MAKAEETQSVPLKAQQAPQVPWSYTGETLPEVLQSTLRAADYLREADSNLCEGWKLMVDSSI